jgi:hypothetical protein
MKAFIATAFNISEVQLITDGWQFILKDCDMKTAHCIKNAKEG